jgi:hypothetical protein
LTAHLTHLGERLSVIHTKETAALEKLTALVAIMEPEKSEEQVAPEESAELFKETDRPWLALGQHWPTPFRPSPGAFPQ